ncbi:MAG: hypothetical protein IJR94_00215 [Synergistaceae bacterium]|nr:hypothetical protein [Synergistaceae bacterium]
MVWKVEYTKTARDQLKKLPHDISSRITEYMDERAAVSPRDNTIRKSHERRIF